MSTKPRKLFLGFILLCALVDCSPHKPIELSGSISKDGAGQILIGNSIEKTAERIQEGELRRNSKNGYSVFKNDREAISFWSKYQDSKIGFVKILTEDFSTEDGLSVGTTLSEIEMLYRNARLILDETNGEVYFAPEKLQVYNGKTPVQLCLFYVEPEEEIPSAAFKFDSTTRHIYTEASNKNGVVSHILIYLWL